MRPSQRGVGGLGRVVLLVGSTIPLGPSVVLVGSRRRAGNRAHCDFLKAGRVGEGNFSSSEYAS